MIIEIAGKAYHGIDIKDLSLRHTLALQRELAITNISTAHTFAEVQELIREFSALDRRGQQEHPEGIFLTAVVIWAARVSAGEEVGLLEAVDFPLSSVRFITEPSDRKSPAGKARAGTKPAAKKKRR